MSRTELADAVNAALDCLCPDLSRAAFYVDFRWVGKLERGEHRWPSAERRAALRRVFQVATDADLGLYSPRRTPAPTSAGDAGAIEGPPAIRWPRNAAATPVDEQVPAVWSAAQRPAERDDLDRRQALTGVAAPVLAALIEAVAGSFANTDGSYPTGEDLTAAVSFVTAARNAYQHSRYAEAAHGLPRLLSALTAEPPSTRDALRAAALSAEAHQVMSGLLLKAEEPALAAICAERSVTAAKACADELVRASSMRAVVHTLLSGGHARQATAVAINAADRLARNADMRRAAALSVYGALLLRGALAAARSEDSDQANTLLDEADNTARHLGTDRNLYWTAFGPTNVAAHRVAVAVELGDAGTAVRLATKVHITKLELPERKAMLLLDTARALTQWGKWDKALALIRHAERFAPEEVHTRPAVHTLVNDLVQRTPASQQRRVREYARHIGAVS